MTKEVDKIGKSILACKTITELSNMECQLRKEYPEYIDDIYEYARLQYYNIKQRSKI